MSTELNIQNELTQLRKRIKQDACQIVQYFNDPEQKTYIDRLKSIMESCYEAEEKACLINQIVEDIRNGLVYSTNSDINVNQIFEERKREIVLSTVQNNGYKEFLTYIQRVITNGEDFVMNDVTRVYIDPWTQKPVTKPIKSSVCGHIYDESTIFQYLKNAPFIKCPHIACGSMVRKDDLTFPRV